MCKRISVVVLFFLSLLQTPQPLAQESAKVPQSYLLRVKIIRSGTGATIENSCVLVTPEGSFRMERSTQHWQDKPYTKVYQGDFSDTEMVRLRQILEDTAFANVYNTPESGSMILSNDLLMVSVYRTDHYQKFAYMANTNEKPFRDIIKPFNGWMKEFHNRKLKENKSATPNGCNTPEMVKQNETIP